jgi:hypothetical protein
LRVFVARALLDLQLRSCAEGLDECPDPLHRDAAILVTRVERRTVRVFPQSAVVSEEVGLFVGVIEVDNRADVRTASAATKAADFLLTDGMALTSLTVA